MEQYILHRKYLVAETSRRKGIGRNLVEQAIRLSEDNNCRLIELETQNTNFPAVQFYLKLGFQITGINTALYDHGSADETALFMTYKNLGYKAENIANG